MFVRAEEAVLWRSDFLFVRSQVMGPLGSLHKYETVGQITLKAGKSLVSMEQCTVSHQNVLSAF